ESDRARVAEYYQRCQDIVQAQAAQLADQRAHLTELYERLTGAEARWEQQQNEAVEEMERLCNEMQDREDALRARSREVESSAERAREERERVNRLRATAECNAAELAARQSAWLGERERRQNELDERLSAVATREDALTELFRRWRDRRKTEIEQLGRLLHES